MDSKIRLSGITRESVVDGLGFRYVVYAQGCPHQCRGCHNPSTHSFEGGELVDIDKIIAEISKNPMLDGLTCSGGECFEKAEQFAELAKAVKALGLSVWAYTGYTLEEIIKAKDVRSDWRDFIKYIDVLVDGRFEIEKKDLSLCFRGSSNQRLIDVQRTLDTGKVTLLAI
jgi:anaerobic ribonucleoside-triphosphate reductase activating protein